MQLVARLPVVIANGASLSSAVTLNGGIPAIIEMPAADLTFQSTGIGGDFANVYDTFGTEIAATVDAARRIRLDPSEWIGIYQLKIRSGTAAAAVNQGAERTLYLEVWE